MALPPLWIEEFVQQFSLCLFPQGPATPLGCHYHFESGCWEIAVFPSMRRKKISKHEPSNYEPVDQLFFPSPFSFDVHQALPLFEEIQHIDWIAIPASSENETGHHLLIEGIVEGSAVLIRVCAEVPKRFQHDQDLIVHES